MTKIEDNCDDLIDLGAASSETKGARPGTIPDGSLPQQYVPMGLSQD